MTSRQTRWITTVTEIPCASYAANNTVCKSVRSGSLTYLTSSRPRGCLRPFKIDFKDRVKATLIFQILFSFSVK